SRVHQLGTRISKNRTKFRDRSCLHGADAKTRVPAVPVAGDDAAVDAGDQLLQLSNLDLSAFVEEELERNPLLERATDSTVALVAAEQIFERGEFADSEDGGAGLGDDAAVSSSETAHGAADGFEPVQEEWLSRDLGSRIEIEQTLDTRLDNLFSE